MGWYEDRYPDIGVLVGQVFKSVENTGDAIVFTKEDGTVYSLHHEQDCCEHVYIESVVGDLSDLENTPILRAEGASSPNREGDSDLEADCESYTWTFYKFASIKGYVDVRFFGSSNGYYGESASLRKIAGFSED